MPNIYAKKSEYKENLAIGLGNVGRQQLNIGALKDAEHNSRQQIANCQELEDKFWEADGHNNLGALYSLTGNAEIAQQEFAKSIALFEDTNGKMAFSNVWTERGKANLKAKNVELAFECVHKSLKFADEWTKTQYPKLDDYVRAHYLLGAAYCANNELTLAEENLSKALNLCRQINMVHFEADILLDTARLRYAQGDFRDAQEKASEALVITERSGYVLQGADVNLFLATLALEGHTLERFKSDGKQELSDKEVATLHAREALKLATCDGPPYYYKVAYEEAERFLEQLAGFDTGGAG